MKVRAKTVDAYIAAAAPAAQKRLREIRAAVRRGAPGATEEMKWNMPAFSSGRILVMFAAFKKHVGVFPTAAVLEALDKETARYEKTRGGIKFSLDKPVPVTLITKMTKLRVRQLAEKDSKWRTPPTKKSRKKK
jgi:uncharacterized protein YdhG (YjbR/CyaY superfamily)